MNVENLRILATKLREPEVASHFNMGEWILPGSGANEKTPLSALATHCGTVACIAGWAAIIAQPETAWLEVWERKVAKDFLDLTDEQAAELFVPRSSLVRYDGVTPLMAAAVVDYLADTGEVDWSVAQATGQ